MKTLSLLITAALVAGFASAQEPAASNGLPTETGTAATQPAGADTLMPIAPASGLFPQAATVPSQSGTDTTAVAPSPAPAPAPMLKGSAEQLRQAIRIRELRTQVMEEPEVQAQLAGANCAKTYAGRNIWMRNYYTLLYTRMEAIDPSLAGELESQLHDILMRYEQRQVRPSGLIEPVKELPGSHSADHGSNAKPQEKNSSKKKVSKFPS